MYTCMVVHVYLGGLLNKDDHSNPRQNTFFLGGGWQSGALYLHLHCTQAVPDQGGLDKLTCTQISDDVMPTEIV